MTGLNKKILCFIDEYGTAGSNEDFFLGAVIVLARDAGRCDKCFSDLLEPNANEIHAVDLSDDYLKGLLDRFWSSAQANKMVLLNHKAANEQGEPPVIYAQAVIETVKIGLKRFQQNVLRKDTIGNIDVIMDVNHHNSDPKFDVAIANAQEQDGRFRGVNRITRLDSAASRLLQLADVIAYSRKWIVSAELRAEGLHKRFGIQIP